MSTITLIKRDSILANRPMNPSWIDQWKLWGELNRTI